VWKSHTYANSHSYRHSNRRATIYANAKAASDAPAKTVK